MFIKLTRFDNRPVWLNAAFIVTVEPRRDGNGAVVVPIGDGLDYDVRERPEEVLRMLDGCPAPKVVPVPVSDCLTKRPEDVSPEPRKPAEPKPAEEKPVEPKPPAAAKKEKPAKKPALELSGEDVVRLQKLSPKSVAKLKNTLASQFRVSDVSETVAALEAKGVLTLDGNHVNWKTE